MNDASDRPMTGDTTARLDQLERRCDLLWRTVDMLVDQALDVLTKGITVELFRQAHDAAAKAVVDAADRFRAATTTSVVTARPLS